ncbi:MAG TPA: tetratricopeptide repeat protein [Verrucomicrobiae bacterium]|nr:tetratricopeptide repeat protein [Verrucomicrobiae bacterium]
MARDRARTNPTAAARKAAVVEPPPKTTLWPSIGLVRHLVIIFGLGVIVLLTFANTLHNTGFALDNKFILLEDPRLRQANRDNLNLIFKQDYWWPKAVSGLYRPLTTLSYLFNYAVLGNADRSTGYHLINFFLHWANVVLVYFMTLVLMERLWPAFFTAAIFATHPIVTESVSNIIGRADLFATLWVLVGFLCYAKSGTVDEEREPLPARLVGLGAASAVLAVLVVWRGLYPDLIPSSLRSWPVTLTALVTLGAATLVLACAVGGWGKLPWLLLLMLATAVGVFCKESGVVVLGVVGLYDFVFRIRKKHPNWLVNLASNFWEFTLKGYVVLAAPFLALWYVRSWVFEHLRPPELPFVDNPLTYIANPLFKEFSLIHWFITSRLTAIKVIGRYFWLLIWPQTLSCDYSYNQIPLVSLHFNSWEDLEAIVALVAVVTVLLVAIRNYRRNKPLFFFIFFFIGTFLPTSNLLRIIGSIMAERFMYLPSIGYAACLVIAVYAVSRWLIPRLNRSEEAQRRWRQMVPAVALGLFVVSYGARTFVRNRDWENDVALWTQDVRACPNSFKTHKSLAFALYEKDPEGKNIDRIIDEAQKAVQVTDKTQIVLLHLGAYYRIKGDTLAQRGPDGTLTPTAASMPWYQKSAEALARAVPLDRAFNDDNHNKELKRGRKPEEIPDIGNHEIYWNLGLSYMRLGNYPGALEAYQYMRHLAPTNPDAYLSLASVYLAEGKTENAAIALIQTLLIDSNREQALQELFGLYRQIDREGCSVVVTPGQQQPKLNADCPLVHKHICAACYGLVEVFVEAKQWGVAEQTRNNALKNYSCSPEPFDKLLATTPVVTTANQ